MKEDILISIIIPVYNNERYITKAVDSVLTQNFSQCEIIIVDDGSTDNTPVIVDDIAKRNINIRVIHKSNQWIYASFNNGIREAKGEYIYILNSDDKISPNSLFLLKTAIEKYNYPDVVWTKVVSYVCDEFQNKISSNTELMDKEIYRDIFCGDIKKVRELWPYLFKSSLAWNQANLYKRKIMLAHPFRNDVYGADTLFNVDIAPYINTCVVLKQCIYEFYVYNKDNMNTSVGKYYSYEHDMFNEIYHSINRLMQDWGIDEREYLEWLKKTRRSQFTSELINLQSKNCLLTIDEKLKVICEHYLDSTIEEVADEWEEMESRTLSGIRDLFVLEMPSEECEYYFLYELLLALLRYEKEEEDYLAIEKAINNPINKKKLGLSFYNKLNKRK